MAAPVAKITVAGATTIPFADLVAPWPDVSMSLSTSTCDGGRTITAWRWYLLSGPPGHGATLSAPNAETCILQNVDKVGNYRLFGRVQDSTGEWSFSSPNAVQSGTTPFGFTAPNRDAFTVITVTTENLALNKLAYGERNWLESSYWGLVDAVDQMRGDLDTAAFGVNAPRTVWVQAQAGDADADGSMTRPFNPTSAAAAAVAGPFTQAIAALAAMDISDAPESGRTIMALGGDYSTEPISITNADAPWRILCHGEVVVGGAVTYTVKNAGHLHDPDFMIAPVGDGAFVANAVALNLGDAAAASQWGVRLKECYFASAAVSGSLVAGALAYLDRCQFAGNFNVPNLTLYDVAGTTIAGTLTCRSVREARGCTFDNITVTDVGGGDRPGFYDCGWSASPVFTGPEGSALFDPITQHRFYAHAGSLAGGALLDDVLRVGDLINEAGTWYIAASGAIEMSSGDMIDILSTYGMNISSLVSDIDIVAGESILIDSNGGEASGIWLEANDEINSTSGGSTTIQATNGVVNVTGANGVTIETTGVNKALTLQTTNGAVVITAEDTTNGTVDVFGRASVNLDSDVDISAWAVAGLLQLHGGYDVEIDGPRVRILPGFGAYTDITGVVFSDDAGKVKGTKAAHGLSSFHADWAVVSLTTNGNGTYRIEYIDADTFYLKEPLDNSYSTWAAFTGADVTGTVRVGHMYLYGITSYYKTAGSMLFESDDDVFIAADSTANIVVTTGAGDVNIANNGTGDVRLQADVGDVVISPGGMTYVNSPLASKVVSPGTSYKVMNALGMSGAVSAIAATTLTTVYSKSLGAGFFTGTHGQTIKGSAHFSFAANTDSKLIYGVMTSTSLFSCGGGINGKDGHLEFEIWFTNQADPNDYGWWYRLSTYTKGSKAAVTLEEDSGFGTFVDTGAIDFELMVDGTNASDITFNGCRIWSITE